VVPSPLQCDHRESLVALSYLISVFGAFSALECAAKIPRGRVAGAWLFASALAMGGGAVWSMHFIGMLACRLPVPVTYGLGLTLASLAIAVVMTGIGLAMINAGRVTAARVAAGGVVAGLGISAMHYTGMAAMQMAARTVYDPFLVAASVAIAVAAAGVAFLIAFNPRGRWHRLGSALVMGVAVCGMHYTGMAAATFLPVEPTATATGAVDQPALGRMVFAASACVLGLLLWANHRADVVARQFAALGDAGLRQAEEAAGRLRAVLDAALDAVIGMDADDVITYWNPRAEAIFGWGREEALGRRLRDLIIPERYREGHRRGLARFLATGEGPVLDRRIELHGLRRDGTEFPVELSITAVKQGETYSFSAFLADITERKRSEAELRRYADVFRNMQVGLNVWCLQDREDPRSFKLISTNPAAAHSLGVRSEDILGKRMDEAFPHMLATDLPRQYREVILSGEGRDLGEVRYPYGEGAEDGVFSVKVFPLPGDCVGVAFDDITEHRRLESQLLQSQKMEAVGRLAGGVAHDFNNSLGVILGYTELLMRQASEAQRGKLEQILKATQRATGLTRQLLAFSRKQVVDPKVLDLNVLLSDLEKMLGRLIGEDIDLAIVPGADLGQVKADPGQLEQVVMNLCVNARDAMRDGGLLSIETANVDLDAGHIARHEPMAPGRYVMLAVSDTGCGIEKEILSRIFEPFFTTKESGKGTGLGLAMVYGIVKQAGGSVWVYSEVGRGTTFKIYLPRVDEPAVAPDVPETTMPSKGWETILLVEDEGPLRTIAREILEEHGYRVLEASGANSGANNAIEIAHRHPEPIHLLVTDVVMPGMNGRVLAESLMAARPELRVLYMSGYTDDVIAHSGVLEPGTLLLEKPFTALALLGRVRAALGERGPGVNA
jgi:two-component system, cell cycle sensor histidine kinase and response regulator CckA